MERGIKKKDFLEEMKENMNYAKWFRPVLGASLSVIIFVMLTVFDEFGLIKAFKLLYQSAGPPERLDIVFSLTLITGTKLVALAIDAMIAAIGLFLIIASLAWWYPTFTWVSVLCFI